ncbi:unnamed protein product [marine sediment metagenome]|uniref:Uncharacterized protein n=1 Tax=marine sediment metagenome TaxID=412755 RepID=X1E2R7_9ZZZZ
MGKEISTGLKYILLVHFILGLIIGVIFLFFPKEYCDLFSIPINDHGMYRLVGAASLALGFSSYLAYRNHDWDVVKLFVQMELIWLIGANIGMMWWLFTGGPVMAWLIEIMFIFFLVAFLFFYFQEKK